ncbi:MAG: hypothetical protein HC835_09190 [Oscillatoriales cyanobacterium RM2_1_1]|nr:hypothetical protein [Oscillatoriales cyanobacterium RM2_1_1]
MGDSTRAYYLGQGTLDFARILDLVVGTDKIQLHGGETYQLQVVGRSTQIQVDADLIGVISGVTGLSLNDLNVFYYV